MSTIYNSRDGDTFDSISRIVYGSPSGASSIRRANPGLIDPLRAGAQVSIPTFFSEPRTSVTNDPDEVGIRIDGQVFNTWQSVTVTRSTDSFDVVQLSAPLAQETRDQLVPMSFKDVTITVGGDPLFSGTLVDVDPVVSDSGAVVSLGAYSRPGVLQDCTPSAASFPLQYKDLDVFQIAEQLCEPFGVKVLRATAPQQVGAQFNAPIDVGDAFGGEGVALDPGKSILSFLMELTQQRGLLMSNTARGELLLSRPPTLSTPSAKFAQGVSPLMSVTPSFSPRRWFSHLTTLAPVTMEGGGSSYTAKNKHAGGVIRPYVSEASDATDGTAQQAAETKRQRMLENAATYTIQLPTWRSPSGKLWTPGETVSLVAEDAMVYNPYNFILKRVEFHRAAETGAASASLVLNVPSNPETMPWDQ